MDKWQIEIIQELSERDAQELAELYAELMPEIEQIPQKIQMMADTLLTRDGHYLICAREIERIVGIVLAVSCQSLAMNGRGFLVLEDFVVRKTHRHQGIGQKLLAYAEQLAKKENCWAAMLLSSSRRTGAHRFYEANGFTDSVKGFRKVFRKGGDTVSKKVVLKTGEQAAPVAPYSTAVRKGNLVFISGQVAMKDNQVVHGTAKEETELVMESLKHILEYNKMTMEDIVKCSVYFVNQEDFGEINEVYQKYFEAPPARIAAQVVRLYDDVKVEIDAIAITSDE